MKKLVRTPGITIVWMVLAVLYVMFLFSRWDMLKAPRGAAVWWTALLLFLLFDYFFLILPVKVGNSLRVLDRRGRAWAAITWMTVCVFVWLAVPATLPVYRKQHPLIVASAGLLVLIFLVYAILRFRLRWFVTPIRSIVAGEAGGFIVRFPFNDELATAVQRIPGALPTSDPTAWAVPAEGEAAAALLRLAKDFDFDFVPQRSRAAELIKSRDGA
jgi:hypothetical protein